MASNYQLGLYNELMETKEALAREKRINQQRRKSGIKTNNYRVNPNDSKS